MEVKLVVLQTIELNKLKLYGNLYRMKFEYQPNVITG